MELRKVLSLSMILALTLSSTLVLVKALEAWPQIYVEPNNILVNGIVNIHVTTYDPDPDLPSVPDDFLYILVHQVVVRYPHDGYTEEFMLGTASAPGITGQKIRVDYGEDVAIPFGTPVSGVVALSWDGVDYYWWRTRRSGASVWPNEMGASTEWTGEYEADVEGRAYYGTGEQDIRLRKFFDIPDYFTASPPPSPPPPPPPSMEETATGYGTRIKPKGTWFMYNYYDDTQSCFNIQAGNPANGLNFIGTFTVTNLGGGWYVVNYDMDETIEIGGLTYDIVVVDEHLGISDKMNFKAVPGQDDNQDFGVPFQPVDGSFYIFAHFEVEFSPQG